MLKELTKAVLHLKAENCEFYQTEVTYLDLIIEKRGDHKDPEMIAVTKNWPVPKCVFDIRSFVRFVNFYQLFIQTILNIVLPLIALTGKEI